LAIDVMMLILIHYLAIIPRDLDPFYNRIEFLCH